MKRSEWARPSPTVMLAVLALLVLPLALAPRAEAFIYWTSAGAVGRANLDGTGINPHFIHRAGDSGDVAVDPGHLYWTVAPTDYTDLGEIARANLDGTKVEKDFISGSGPLAVDQDHIFWSWNGGHPTIFSSAIGRANIDGTGVDLGFLRLGDPVGPVAVGASHIYWGQFPDPVCCAPGFTPVAAIGRANLGGSAIDPDFIRLPFAFPGDVVVDAAHIYWINASRPQEPSPATIGRADLDGTGVDPEFIDDFDPDANGPTDLAVDDEHIYWTDGGPIGRANLDGTGLDHDFIDTGSHVASLAVDDLTDTELAGKASAKRTQRQKGKKVIVKVKVKAKERLTAKATGKIQINPTYKLKPQQIDLTRGETKRLKLSPKKKGARKIVAALKRGQVARAKLTVKLTDPAGNRETEKLRVRLKR